MPNERTPRKRGGAVAAAPSAAVIIAGDDSVAVDEALKRAVAESLAGADPATALATFDGRDVEPVIVFDELRTLPLLAPRRVVLIDNGAEFAKRAAEPLKAYLAAPAKSATLILVARGEKGPATAFKPLAKLARLISCTAPRRVQDRIQWVINRAAQRQKRLTGPNAKFLLDLVGGELLMMDSEIEKLSVYVGDRADIRREDIEALVSPTRVEPVYELGNAVTARDRKRALRIAEDLLTEGVELPIIIGALRAHLRRFWQVKAMRRAGRSPADAARELGEYGRVWLIEKLFDQVEAVTDEALRRAFRELLAADVATKTGALTEAVALERFLIAATK